VLVKNEKHFLLTLKLFQTCMKVFLLLNTKEDILRNFGEATQNICFLLWKSLGSIKILQNSFLCVQQKK